MITPLLISAKDLKELSIIDSNATDELISKLIIRVTDIDIRRLLGTELFKKICTDVNNGTLSGYYQTLVYDYLINYIVLGVEFYYISDSTYKFTNKGVMTKDSAYGTPPGYYDLSKIMNQKESIMKEYADEVKMYILNNLTHFTEYYNIQDSYGKPGSNYIQGTLWLGRKKRI